MSAPSTKTTFAARQKARAKLLVVRFAHGVVRPLRRVQLCLLRTQQAMLHLLPLVGMRTRQLGPPRGLANIDRLAAESGGRLQVTEYARPEKRVRSLEALSLHGKPFAGFESRREYTTERLAMVQGSGLACCGDQSFAFLADDDWLVNEFSFDIWTNVRHHLFRKLRLPKAQRLEGVVCSVLEPQWATYGHWLLDFAPRLAWAKEWLDARGVKARYLMYYQGKPHEKALLAALNISESDVISWRPGCRLEADEWVLPTYTSFSGGNLTAESMERLRKLFMPPSSGSSRPGRRLYLSRRADSFRRVINEDAVMACLARRGFEVLEPAKHGLKEQAAIFGSAEVVVGVVSSGLSNIAFMPSGATVVEIFPDDFFMPIEWAQCDLLGLRYYYLFAGGRLPAASASLLSRFADVHVDVALLERTLDLALEGQVPSSVRVA